MGAVVAFESDPPNTLCIHRIMLAVDDVFARLPPHGPERVGGLEHHEGSYRLCYVRGPEGIVVALAEQLSRRQDPPRALTTAVRLSPMWDYVGVSLREAPGVDIPCVE